MAKKREREIWKVGSQPETLADQPRDDVELNARRERCFNDPKFFYDNCVCQTIRDRVTRKMRPGRLGRIHDFVLDFILMDEEGIVRYSTLSEYLPAKVNGAYPERWIYFPTLDAIPDIQDGPTGHIADMFYGQTIWQGVIVRVVGEGLDKCLLIPRGHLKSTLSNLINIWYIVRDPASRTLVRSVTTTLSRQFLSDLKYHFENNERFQELFSHLGPPHDKRTAWNADFIQVMTLVRRGVQPTLSAMGMETESIGTHFDRIVLDDVVGESNTATAALRELARMRVQRLNAVRDPGTPILNIGTRSWHDDVHGDYIEKDGAFHNDTSFLVATVFDADARASNTVTGMGKPIFNEIFTTEDVEKARRGIKNDREFYGYYFNQFAGTTALYFSPAWVQWYEGGPEVVAENRKLDILIGVDCASGKPDQKGKLDYTAACVLGQAGNKIFFLDGFREKLPYEVIPKAILDIGRKWQQIAARYGGTVRCGVEREPHTYYLHTALDYEMRSRGPDGFVSIVPVDHKQVAKHDRIKLLVQAYSDGFVYWPRRLEVHPIRHERLKTPEPYDVVAALDEEYRNYQPNATRDDMLDAHTIAFLLARGRDWKDEPVTPARMRGLTAFPARAEEVENSEVLSSYHDEGNWELSR